VDTQQALGLATGNDSAVLQAEQQAVQHAADLDARHAEQARQQRVEAALAGHLLAAERELTALAPALRDADLQHGHAHLQGWAERLDRAGVAYIAAVRQIAAEASAAGNPAVLRSLGDVVLPDLTAPASPWVAHGRVKLADSSTVPLGADAIDAALAAELSAPRRLLNEVTSYVPFSVREASDVRQVGSWAGTNGGTPIAPTVAAEDDAPARTTTVPPPARRGRSPGVAARVA
jgi:hypothetical protein